MGCLGELRIIDAVGMSLFHTGGLVIADCIKLIVCNRRGLGLEFVQLDGNILVLQCLHINRIGFVVNQDIRIYTNFYQMNHIVVHDTALVGDSRQPGSFQSGTKHLDKFPCPDFRINPFTEY